MKYFLQTILFRIESFIIYSWNDKCKESNCGFRKILASLWLLSAHPNFVKRREKSFPVIEFLFYRNIYALFLKQMGWLWECLEMIFRIFPVYTQKTVPQRYLFFSICIGIAVRSCCVGCLIDTLHSSVKIFYLFVSSQLGFIFLWSCIQVHLEIYSQRFYKIFMYLTFDLAKINTL